MGHPRRNVDKEGSNRKSCTILVGSRGAHPLVAVNWGPMGRQDACKNAYPCRVSLGFTKRLATESTWSTLSSTHINSI